MLVLDPATTAFAGDWHGNLLWSMRAVLRAGKAGVDTIVHLGDFAFRFQQHFLDELEATCARQGVRILFLRGNHDSTEFLRGLGGELAAPGDPYCDPRPVTPHIAYLPDGMRLRIGDKTALVLGGAGSIDRGHRERDVSWWGDERLDLEVARAAIAAGPADIVLSHDAPAGVDLHLDPSFAAYFETSSPGVTQWCEEHRELLGAVVEIVRPRLVVHGHHHRVIRARGGRTYTFRNVGLDQDGSQMSDNLVSFSEITRRVF